MANNKNKNHTGNWAVYYANSKPIVCTTLSNAFEVAAEYAKHSNDVEVKPYKNK